MTPAGCSGTPGQLLDEDPVLSAMDAHSHHHLRHFLPNSARIGYATEGAAFYLHADVHRRFQRPLKGLGTCKTGSNIASKHAPKHEARPPRIKKEKGKKERKKEEKKEERRKSSVSIQMILVLVVLD